MTTAAVVLLGVVALASLAQAVFLVIAVLEGRRIARSVDSLQARVGGEVKPLLGDLTRATENLAAASGVTVGQARRIDAVAGDVAGGVTQAQEAMRDVVVPAAARIVSLTAAVRVLRGGLSFYRRVRGRRRRGR
jgi:hypothetical protein